MPGARTAGDRMPTRCHRQEKLATAVLRERASERTQQQQGHVDEQQRKGTTPSLHTTLQYAILGGWNGWESASNNPGWRRGSFSRETDECNIMHEYQSTVSSERHRVNSNLQRLRWRAVATMQTSLSCNTDKHTLDQWCANVVDVGTALVQRRVLSIANARILQPTASVVGHYTGAQGSSIAQFVSGAGLHGRDCVCAVQ